MDDRANRVPTFELHIRPLFRLLDREHMLGHFDLWDLQSVWTNRTEILDAVSNLRMPPEPKGGPWPEEFAQLFRRWSETGTDSQPGHHLVLAAPQGNYGIAVKGGAVTVSAKILAPTNGCRSWFEMQSITATERTYALYLEPAYPSAAPAPRVLPVIETFPKNGITKLTINDASGSREFPVE
jgi:hypothetical protein